MTKAPERDVIPVGSCEYYYVRGIFAFDLSSPDYGDPTDPDANITIQFAFLAPTAEADGGSAWLDGEWVSWSAEEGAVARILLDVPGVMVSEGATEKPMRKVPPGLKIT
jgi:hypothetical protein